MFERVEVFEMVNGKFIVVEYWKECKDCGSGGINIGLWNRGFIDEIKDDYEFEIKKLSPNSTYPLTLK
jgi:hypothetical protein